MMLKTRKELAAVCSLLVAGVAFGASDVVRESFETAADFASLGEGWTGSGTMFATNYNFVGAAGYVLSSANHTTVLSIDDTVKFTASSATTANDPVLVDLMVQAMVPEEPLEDPEADVEHPVQIAVGVDTSETDGKGWLKVYCKPKTNNSVMAWCPLKEVDAETWHRVSLVFDYSAGFAQVRIDGEPIMTENGYLTASSSAGQGAWYQLVTSSTQLTSVEVVGTTGLDDLLIAQGSDAQNSAVVAGAQTVGDVAISNAWFDAYGIAWDTDAKYDDSGLTLAQKYEAGLSPLDNAKFEITDMSMSGSSATFMVPVITPPAGYTIQLQCSPNPAFTGGGVTSVDATNTEGSKTITVPEGANVLYYRLHSQKND